MRNGNGYVTSSLLSMCHAPCRFPNMGILHVTKKKVPEVLTRRLLQQMKMRESALENLEDDIEKAFSEGKSTISALALSP